MTDDNAAPAKRNVSGGILAALAGLVFMFSTGLLIRTGVDAIF